MRWTILFALWEAFNAVRSRWKSKGDWKISFHKLREEMYTDLWKSLPRIKKVGWTFFAAEQGRAQTLRDNFLFNASFLRSYQLPQLTTKTISRLFTELFSPIPFLAIEGLAINIWCLSRGK